MRQCRRVMPLSPTLGQRTRARWRRPVRPLSCCSPPVVTALQSAKTSFCSPLNAAMLCSACNPHNTSSVTADLGLHACNRGIGSRHGGYKPGQACASKFRANAVGEHSIGLTWLVMRGLP